jgi:hypothetical protein
VKYSTTINSILTAMNQAKNFAGKIPKMPAGGGSGLLGLLGLGLGGYGLYNSVVTGKQKDKHL